MKVGFIGLGIMGSRMAARLQRFGFDLVVHNRTASKAAGLLANGAAWAATPAAAAAQANILITMLAHPKAVEALALGEDGFLPALGAGQLWVDCSTVNPDFAQRMAREASARGLRYLDAPVLGSRGPAENGHLIFVVGGAEADAQAVQPLFDAMGREAIYVGGSGMGTALKLVVNTLLATSMAAFAEAAVLGQSLGIDRDTLFQILIGGPVVAPFVVSKQGKMETHNYDPEFPLQWMQKDLQMASAAAYESGAALPLGNAAKELYRLAMRHGLAALDFSAIYHFLAGERDEG